MKIYVGRWDLLPESWEGINGLYEKSEEEIEAEVERQIDIQERGPKWEYDWTLGIYTEECFEETFNGDNERRLNGTDYWIKIF